MMKKILAAVLSVLLLCAPMTAAAYAAEEEKANTKSETVYVLCGADGTVQKVLSSCRIENNRGDEALSDVSDLENITVVKGNATFSTGENGSLTWRAAGNDVYYQGTADQTPPVGVKLTYTLDGEELPAKDVNGVTGRLTLRVDYENTLRSDGEKTADTMVPVLFLTGLVLDNGQAENIQVTNAKMVDDGTHTVVLGAALPGIRDCFDLENSEDIPEIPAYVEVCADVTDFEAPMTLTVATSEPFSGVDASGLDRVDDLKASVGDLTDAMAQLIEGSGQLYDGLITLSDKTAELAEGVEKLSEGSQALTDGLDTLTENNDALTGGASQIFDALLAQANSALAATGLPLPELTADNYAATLEGLLSGNSAEIPAEQLSAVAETIGTLKAQLDQVHEFVLGLAAYTNGVASARAGAQELNGGINLLLNGAPTSEEQPAQEGVTALPEGVNALRDGALALKDGLTQLDEEGIQKLTNAVDGDLTRLVDSVRDLLDASQGYTTFSGLSEETTGTVRFIIRTDSVGKS